GQEGNTRGNGIRKTLHEPRHRVSGGPPPFQAKPAEELV
ncbi:hypothetical protein, partial [Pseudomonas sp. FG-3G]